jgi:hypothetical protein
VSQKEYLELKILEKQEKINQITFILSTK